jgi:hypothetical protein
VDHTHNVTSDYSIPNNDIEREIIHKIQFLYATLDERLNTDQANSLAHPYGDHNGTSSVYLELKTHALAFTMEQLSHDAILQYMGKMQNSGKWCHTLFLVTLHWHEKIKEYMWLKLIGLLPTQSLCLMQSAVDYVISLEYMQQNDHGEQISRKQKGYIYLHRCFTGK